MASHSDNWRENLEVAALTSVGMRRSNNQDSHAVVLASDYESWVERGHLLIVADGMGAHAAGELASKLAVDHVPHTYHKQPDLAPPTALHKAIVDANQWIHGRGQADVGFHGMGTTCSSLVLLPEGAMVGHVGDSRVYRLRQQVLEQLTFDHSLVWEMMATGQIVGEEGASFVPKNVITRSLGPNAQVKVDIEGPFPIEIGDTYLLCSDGLTGPVKDEELAVILGALPLEDAVQTLIDLANLRGGPDNITVVAARVSGPLDGAASGEQGAGKGAASTPIHPALLVSTVLLLMIGVVLAVLGELIAAGLSIVGSLLVGMIALMQHYGGVTSRGRSAIGGRFGKGPYRRYDGRANAAITETLAELVRRLTEAARRDALPIDWPQFNRDKENAELAAADQKHAAATIAYCKAIRNLTDELHQARRR